MKAKIRFPRAKQYALNLFTGAAFIIGGFTQQYPSMNIFYQQPEKQMHISVSKPRILEILTALNLNQGEYVFIINKEEQKAQLYKREYVLIDETRVSTGRNPGEKQRLGDNKTPSGVFEVTSLYDSTNWRFNGELAYGPKAVRLNCGSWDSNGNHNPKGRSPIMVHGTNEPWLLGKPASHGCLRLENLVVKEYIKKGYLDKGTPVAIINNHDHIPINIRASYVTKPLSHLDCVVECVVNSVKPYFPEQSGIKKSSEGGD
ncbi:L,D-transpeptidase [Candidatus Woesearchaeota archaeon]|nr:L,D-transpeptidase [Candidatus Woesearchaeota archaeon]